jgi:hypothetical protein
MKAIILALSIMITGCQTTSVVSTKIVFIEPPAALLNCPQIKKSQIPNAKTATNKQIVEFINLLYKYNKQCGINMDQVRKYIANYKVEFVK